jgi:uncharacterized protein (TIGR00251 family)
MAVAGPLKKAEAGAGKAPSATLIQVKVRPGARRSVLEAADDGTWLAELKASPVDGKANEELIALVAQRFQCRRAAVTIRSGASGRIKRLRIEAA